MSMLLRPSTTCLLAALVASSFGSVLGCAFEQDEPLFSTRADSVRGDHVRSTSIVAHQTASTSLDVVFSVHDDEHAVRITRTDDGVEVAGAGCAVVLGGDGRSIVTEDERCEEVLGGALESVAAALDDSRSDASNGDSFLRALRDGVTGARPDVCQPKTEAAVVCVSTAVFAAAGGVVLARGRRLRSGHGSPTRWSGAAVDFAGSFFSEMAETIGRAVIGLTAAGSGLTAVGSCGAFFVYDWHDQAYCADSARIESLEVSHADGFTTVNAPITGTRLPSSHGDVELTVRCAGDGAEDRIPALVRSVWDLAFPEHRASVRPDARLSGALAVASATFRLPANRACTASARSPALRGRPSVQFQTR